MFVCFSVHDGVPVVGLDCGDEAGAWLDEFLQKPGHRLIFAAPSVERRSFQNGTVKYKAWTAHIDPSAKVLIIQPCILSTVIITKILI